MEGILSKWTNYWSGWKNRYFTLTKDVLRYYKRQGGKLKGTMHLNLVKIIPHKSKDNIFLLDTGLAVLHLKAKDKPEVEKWIEAINLGKAQAMAAKNDASASKHVSGFTDGFNFKIGALWKLQATL